MDDLSPLDIAEQQMRDNANAQARVPASTAPLEDSPLDIAERDQKALRQATELAVGQDPDEAAEIQRISNMTGVTPDAILDSKDALKAQIERADLERTLQANPKLADFVRRNPGITPQLKDEVKALGEMDKLIAAFKSGFSNLKAMVPATQMSANTQMAGKLRQLQEKLAKGEPITYEDDPWGYAQATPEFRETLIEQLQQQAKEQAVRTAIHSARAAQEMAKLPDSVTNVLGAETWGDAFDNFLAAPADFVLAITAQQLAQNLPIFAGMAAGAVIGGPGGAVAGVKFTSQGLDFAGSLLEGLQEMGVNTADPQAMIASVEQLMQDPAKLAQLRNAAYAHSEVASTTDALGGGLATRVVAPRRLGAPGIPNTVARHGTNLAAQAGAQGALGGAGEFAGGEAAGRPSSPGDIIAEVVGEVGTAGPEVAIGTAARLRAELQAAKRTRDGVEKLMDAAASSKFAKERNPEAFRDYVDGLAAEGFDEVYVDGAVLNQLMSQAGKEADQILAAVPEVARQMDEAAYGTDVTIPTADLITHFSGTGVGVALLDHVRTSANGQSFAEISLRAQQLEQLEQSANETAEAQSDPEKWRESQQRIQDAVYEGIISTGNMGHEQARVSAVLTAAMYATQAGRVGVMPHELAARYGIQIGDERSQTPIDQWNTLVRDFNAAKDRGDGGAMRRLQSQLQALRSTVEGVELAQRESQIQTEEFRKWFAASQVVDEAGAPRVMYHGTPKGNEIGDQFTSWRGIAGFFAFDPKVAEDYAGAVGNPDGPPAVFPVFVKAENIFDLRNPEHREMAGLDDGPHNFESLDGKEDLIGSLGFDAFYDFSNDYRTEEPGGLGVLDAEQIKSAIGNDGGFDPVNPSILRQDFTMSFGEDRQRVTGQGKLSRDERNALARDLSVDKVKAAIAAAIKVKGEHPESDGWAPLTLVGATTDEKGKVELQWQAIPYRFNVPPGKDRAPSKHDQAWVDKVAGAFHALVDDIYARADAGDKNAQVIVAQASWYRGVTEVLRRHFGAQGDLLSDLLGATSPNTPVATNWKFAVDILRRFSRGEFREDMQKFVEYLDGGGRASAYPAADKIRQLSGKLYGMNSGNAMLALADAWRVIEPGSAPKARNFALNLIGQSDMATIDVWAARMLRRAANMLPGTDLPRIPPPAETGVDGNWNASATGVTGAFGFGAAVMERVADRLRSEGRDITAPDLQAVAWFAEKELWAQNKWTTALGEGGSFEQMIEGDPPQRWLAGWSIQQGEKTPETAQVSTAQARVMGILAGDNDVVAARVAPTVGLYGGVEELSFDTEWTVRKDGEHNPALVAAEIAKLAREHQQYDFFVSRVLDAREAHPNARPGVEIYFTSQQALDNARQYLAKFTSRGQDGFTMAVDPRAGEGKYIGVRLQYVPEISARWDEGERSRLLADPATVLQEKANALAEIAAEVEEMEGVAFADLFHYDTTVIGKESYDDFIGRATQAANRTLGSEGSVGERVAQAVARYRAAERAAADADVPTASEAVGSARSGDGGEGGVRGFAARPRQPDAITLTGIHYGKQAGLTALEGSRNGTGIAGAEQERLRWSSDARIKRRVYFYPHIEGQPLPKPESGLGPHIYRQTLGNILGPGPRRDELWGASRHPNEYGYVDADETANHFEAALITAGYDGYVASGMIVMLDADVPVEMVERPQVTLKQQESDKLSPAEREIEARLAAKIDSDFDAAVARYNAEPEAQGGKVLNTDVARELSEDYRADRSQSRAVHEPASAFIKRLYAQKLAEPKGPGGNVFFTAGGTGAGKSSGIRKHAELQALMQSADIVYDTNMSTLDSSVKKIEQALASGRTVDIVYTYRDPVESLVNGALTRAERMGRTVPLDNHIETHVGARRVVAQLAERYADDDRVNIRVVDNSRDAMVVPLDSIPEIDDNGLEQLLRAALRREHEEGRITRKTFEASGGLADRDEAGADPGEAGRARGLGAGPREAGGGSGTQEPLAQSARGTISFGRGLAQDGAFIRLLRGADASTFVHELGHFYLEMLTDLAAQPGAPAAVVQDLNIVLQWLGTDAASWSAGSIEERRAQHEQFARGFEAYLFEGKAPIPELKGVFARFRAWMLQVYRSLADLNVTLTDEVRGVFDRMIANNDQLQEAAQGRSQAPVFSTPEEAGMSPEEWVEYIATGEEATRDAINMMDRRRLRDMRWLARAKGAMLRKMQDEVAERRAAVEAEVRREVEAEPAALAARFISTGTLPDTPNNAAQRDALDLLAGGKTKLSTERLREIFGTGPAAPWRYLPVSMIAKEDGADPDVVATVFGFKSGDQMVRAILANDIETRVADETEARLLERYGDINSPEALENAVNEALMNAAHQRFTATELATMQEALNPRTQVGTTTVAKGKQKGKTRAVTVNSILDAAKKYAEKVVARTKVRNLRPGKYTAAANRAATKSAELFKKGDIVGAIDAKRDQILNARVARESAKARDDIQVIVDRLQRLATTPPDSIAQDYRDQINVMLERFNLRRASLRSVDRMKSLAEWIEEQRALGVEPPISDELANEAFRTHYTELTVEQLRDLDDAVKGIVHLGQLKQRLLTAKDQREYELVMSDMVASIEKHGGKPRKRQYTPTPTGKRYLTGFLADHRKLPSIIRQLDGVRAGGTLWERIIRPLNEAADKEATLREQSTVAIAKILAPVMKKPRGLAKKVYIDAIGESFTLEQRLAVALNQGNAGNRQRLQDGHGWSPAQVQAILNTLDRTDWTAVQAIWDHIDSYWPEIAAKTQRVGGTLPTKIDAEAFDVQLPDGATMSLRGGYYPAAADPEISTRAGQHDEAEVAANMMRGAFAASMTRRGFLKERAKVATEPLMLALDPLFRHLNDVTHDLAFHEWLIDVNRIRRDKRFADTVRRYYGPDYMKVINDAVHDIAIGDSMTMNATEKVMLRLRQNISAATMGFSLTTAFMQPWGLSQSVVRIGPRWVLQGVAKALASPSTLLATQKTIGEKSEFMRIRAKTFNRELAELHGKVKRNGRAAAVLDASKFFLMQKMQQLVDVPTWLGAYDKAIFDGNDEARAVALADQAVIDSQGSGLIKDLARVQRGGPLSRMLTIFYSYFSTTYNLTREQMAKRGRQVSEGAVISAAIGAATDLTLLYLLPALGPALVLSLLKGEEPPDDEEEWAIWVGKKLASFGLAPIVGLREFSGLIEGYDYSGPAGFRLVGDVGALAKQAGQGEADQAALSAALRALGSATGLPTNQIDRTIKGWQAYLDDDAPPTSILFGPPPKN